MPEPSPQKRAPDSVELRALEQLAREPSSEKRRELMSRLTDFLSLEIDVVSDETTRLLGDTLIALLDRLDEPGRVELSERVAPHHTTPHRLAKRLAHDVSVHVAEPVLSRSPVLTDDDLAEVARDQSEAHLLAMTRRKHLSMQVTDAMIGNGTTRVFEAVVRNSRAEISSNGFIRLSQDAMSSEGLAEALSQRTDIPEMVVEHVIESLPPGYRLRLEQLWESDEAKADELLDDAALEIGQARLASRRGMLEAKVAAKAVTNGRRSLENAIRHFAGSNRVAETGHIISVLSRMPEAFVRAALFRKDGTPIALVCSSIGLKDAAFEEITRMRCSQLGLATEDGHQLLQAYRAMNSEGARRAVQFAAARYAAGDQDWDRRTGIDMRSEEDRSRVGERRSGSERRLTTAK